MAFPMHKEHTPSLARHLSRAGTEPNAAPKDRLWRGVPVGRSVLRAYGIAVKRME